MTAQFSDDNQDQESLEQQMVSYLCKNPDFFSKHPDALAALNLPHEAGSAVSLVERQIKVLRERADKFQQNFQEVLDLTRQNESTAKRLHFLTLKVIETTDFDDLLNTMQDELIGDFKADAVVMSLFDRKELDEHASEAGPALFRDFIEKGRPSCGVLGDTQLQYLFGDNAESTASAAIVPLRTDHSYGILGIGSRDTERFTEDMAVDYLSRLGEVVSAKLNTSNTY